MFQQVTSVKRVKLKNGDFDGPHLGNAAPHLMFPNRSVVGENTRQYAKTHRQPVSYHGVECKDEVYSAHQLACVKYETSPTLESASQIGCSVLRPKVIVEPIDNNNGGSSKKSAIEADCPPSPLKTVPPRSRPIAVTAKLFSSFEPPKEPPAESAGRPHTATKTIFAPRTEDMSKGFLTFSEEEPGLTNSKDIIQGQYQKRSIRGHSLQLMGFSGF
ncbi:hypothetical protein HUJ05_012529 [Dendroctonus ponderosae]|nr:hypothetical protein HUJ05_012529 [Dendroctonus ponderosae]